jgi:3-oxoadipate enol-lactonase
VPVDSGHLWADDTGGDGPVLVLLHPGWGDSSIWLLSWTGCPALARHPVRHSRVRPITRSGGAVQPAWRSGPWCWNTGARIG